MIHKLGAHLSISGGYEKAISKIRDIGGNCLQIFSASPRGWNMPAADKKTITSFIEKKSAAGIAPVYFHASYLINLADSGKIGHMSKLSLIAELTLASRLAVKGSIVHLGSFKNEKNDGKYTTLISNIREVLKKTPPDTVFIIENAGNRKIGQSLDEIAGIKNDIADERVRVCLDTCHLFSAGYDITEPAKLDKFLNEFEKKIGLKLLELWHINDSRDSFGSLRDRHENIGEGKIGIGAFRILLNHEKMKGLPFIIETPGFDGKGPDKKNLEILKKMI